MPANFRRHDTTARNIGDSDRLLYAREKASLIASNADQETVDERLNRFFWKCFEDDAEDEDE